MGPERLARPRSFPDRSGLDALSSEHPHSAQARGRTRRAGEPDLALQAAGIDETPPRIRPAERSCGIGGGRATGVLIDNATTLVESVLPDSSQQEKRDIIRLAVDHCLALGLTGVHDAGIDYDDWDIYRGDGG